MSKRAALAFGLGASLILAAGTANAAGTCSMEIDALQQQLGVDQGANATTGPSDPGVQQPSPGASADTGASGSSTTTMDSDTAASNGTTGTTDNSANATIGANGSGVQQPAPEANATTGTDSSSGSSSTIPGAGTVTETSRTGTLNVEPSARSAALASLEQAKLYAKSGQEDACMSELNSAKQQLGVQ